MAERRDQLEHEKEIARQALAANPTELGLCERYFGHLTDGFNRLERPFRREEPSDHVLRLATMGHNSLRWAFELLLKGYYTQANALSRLAWECWLHGLFLLFYPDRLEEWRDFKTRPKPWRMRQLIAEGAEREWRQQEPMDREQFRSDLDGMYSMYSVYSHPSDIALKVLIEDRDGELWLRLGGAYDDLLIIQSTDMFCYATQMLCTLIYQLLGEDVDYKEGGSALRNDLNAWRKETIGTALASSPAKNNEQADQ